MTIILDGKKVSNDVQDEMMRTMKQHPKDIRIVTVGFNEEPSFLYGRRKKIANLLGIEFDYYQVTIQSAMKILKEFNANQKISGIVIDEGIPKEMDELFLRTQLDPKKDVEGFHPENLGNLMIGREAFSPSTPLAVMALLSAYEISLEGKQVALFGRGKVVGQPLIPILLRENATPTIIHSHTLNTAELSVNADIVIAAMGKAKMIDASYIKEGAVVVDVGMSTDSKGQLSGDVNAESVTDKAGFLSLVKGGIAPLGPTMFMKQIIDKIE